MLPEPKVPQMSATMNAIQIEGDALRWQPTERPSPAPGEVLVQVRAAGLNRADLVQRHGNYPPPKGASPILGLEIAGEVVEVGAEVTSHSPGDRVCALLAGGGYAEYATVDARLALPIPQGMSMSEAAALPEVYFTAWLNLFMEAKLQPGETALIHAGASGVGTAAIQLCREFGVGTILATASFSKLELLEQLGATRAFDRRSPELFEHLRHATSEQGVDVILDPVAANYLEDNLTLLRTDGRLVCIGLMGGTRAELDMGRMLMKRLRLIGSTLRNRSNEAKAQIARELREQVWPLFDERRLSPIIDRVFPMAQAEEAHAHLASNATIGKVILTLE